VTSLDDPLAIASLVSGRLTALGITHMLSGSTALVVYAEPRMSRDVDFVVDLGGFQVPRFVAAFAPDFYVDEAMVRDAVRRRDLFNIIHEESGWKVDLVVAKEDPYRQLELARRAPIRIGNADIPVVSREDLILTKLWSSKDSGSELQRRDVRNLIVAAESLYWAYLRRWAAHLGVADLLEEVRGG
jgi:hypothetical protein